MFRFCFIFLTLLSTISSCSQDKLSFFQEKNYRLFKTGSDDGYKYVQVFKNNSDTGWVLKKIYLDSLYSKLVKSTFFHNGVPDGPSYSYFEGEITTKVEFKEGKKHGERLNYENGIVRRRSFFENGRKVGIWYEYDEKGRV